LVLDHWESFGKTFAITLNQPFLKMLSTNHAGYYILSTE